jgi:RNA polymerase sigma factor (sigma-70 family)
MRRKTVSHQKPNAQQEQSIESTHRFISRIVTEAGIQHALERAIDPPSDMDDEATKQSKLEAIARQRTERERFLKRYQVAILGYLGVYLRDADAVSDVFDKFVDKWLDGKLRGYDPTRSFRLYLKEVLRNDVYSYWSSKGKQRKQGQVRLDTNYEQEDQLDRTASELFDRNLGDEILEEALEALGPGHPNHQVLTFFKDAAIAGKEKPSYDDLSSTLGKSAQATRQVVSRARKEYAKKIIEQVIQLIKSQDLNLIRETLIDLKLLPYCQKALDEMELLFARQSMQNPEIREA